MLSNEWVEENFRDAKWLGAGTYGEAWLISFQGRPAALKITGSTAEKFCVEAIKDIQQHSGHDPFFPLPYIFLSRSTPSLEFNKNWYEVGDDEWPPIEYGDYFYIREFADPLSSYFEEGEEEEEEEEILPHLHDLANKIYREYGLVIMDVHAGNWGFVQRGGTSFLVPIDLACGTKEHWWNETIQDEKIPFEAPYWLHN